MATIKVIQPEPVPPPKKYVLELSLEEVTLLKSLLNLYHVGPNNKKADIGMQLWNLLSGAGVPHYKLSRCDPMSEQFLCPEDYVRKI